MTHQIKLIGEGLPQSPYGTDYFWFDSLSGAEKINELFEYHLIVKVRDEYHQPAHGYRGLEGYSSKQSAASGGTPGSNLNLQQLIGTELAVRIRLDGIKLEYSQLDLINQISETTNYQSNLNGARFYRGLVNRVELLPVKNRHATYKITLVPWLWLLTKTTNYKIFQKKTVLQIIESILSKYPYPVDYRCSADYSALDFQVQYGESDFVFIQRLMQEHGINFHFEHSQNHLTLVLSDHNAAYKDMEAKGYQNLSIYPPNQRFPEQAEYIETFEPAQQLVSGKVQLSDYQFKQPSLTQTAQDQFIWDHLYAEQEVYEWQHGDFSLEQDGAVKAKQRVEALYQHGYRALGHGHLKGLQTGFKFQLENHPNSDSNRKWLILGVQTTIQDISAEKFDNQFYDAQVEFLVQPDEQILRPDHTLNKPLGRPQTALVVGPEGEEIYTDPYGRVKVKFYWERSIQSDFEDEAVTNDNANTCWLRVSTAWAGNQFGTIHVPRIGQEVIVDFFNGDPDMPFVAGRLNNPEQMPVWELPSQQALSGIKSKELGGSQSNQLVMDDTQGQVQVHLKSDHQASELNLGYITRIPDHSGRQDFRGEGFELRTDGHGVVRSGQGLILTTHGKNEASSYIKSIDESSALMQQAVNQQQTYLQDTIDHAVDERAMTDTAIPSLKQDYQSIKGNSAEKKQYSELTNPHTLISSASSISNLAIQNIHHFAKENITLTSGADLSIATGKKLIASAAKGIGLFAQSLGAKLVAASGKVEIHAQTDAIDIIADEVLKVISKKKSIEISAAEEILLNVKGNFLKITPDGIEQGCNGEWKAYASQHQFLNKKTIDYQPPQDPYDEMYILRDPSGNPVSGFAYKITTPDGKIYKGVTNALGETIRLSSGYKDKGICLQEDDGQD